MSPKKCAFGCQGKLNLFSFPKNPELLQKWMQFVFPGEKRSVSHVFVCSRHFGDESFTNKAMFHSGFAQRLKLKDGAVPVIKHPDLDPQAHCVDGQPGPNPLPAVSCDGDNIRPARTASPSQRKRQVDIMPGEIKKIKVGYDQQAVAMDIKVEMETESLGEDTTSKGSTTITEMGTPDHLVLKCDPDWSPSLHFGHTEVKASESGDEAAPESLLVVVKEEPATAEGDQMENAGANDNTAEQQECHLCSCRRAVIEHLVEENQRLKKELAKMNMEEDYFKDDDAKVKYYTGLPCFALLMGVLTQLLPSLPQTGQKLSPFQMLLSTLMLLKLNLPIQHIAYLFSVDLETVSTTFIDTIGTMFRYLKPLVLWPERHCLEASMPHQFVEAFGNHVSVIVDCFEIHTQSASNHEAQTVSHQKHHQTLKYLFGITPQGSISFISKGWEGCVSDKHVAENSGLLNHLLPGDLVLADRGFNIKESVGLMCAEVKSGSIQLDAKDEEETRRIAHLRLHVERVIGCARTKYNLLNGIVPASMVLPCQGEDMTFLDKIVTVCCALTNVCPGVVMEP